ncbi:MAG: YqeG family HAD IIIA-type phosphatase [Negativicutes bacterium]|nr:YqeG family HAD IIIA-type phosphatase [Negativicutes bacterium]
MLNFLRPALRARRLSDVSVDRLWHMGIRGLIIDVDNTLVPWGKSVIPPAHLLWLETWRGYGGKLAFLSNAWHSSRRLPLPDNIARPLCPFTIRAFKPLPFSAMNLQRLLGLQRQQIAIIGDQILTDVLCGKICGFYTIRVDPMSGREFFTTKLNRWLEKFVLADCQSRTDE